MATIPPKGSQCPFCPFNVVVGTPYVVLLNEYGEPVYVHSKCYFRHIDRIGPALQLRTKDDEK